MKIVTALIVAFLAIVAVGILYSLCRWFGTVLNALSKFINDWIKFGN